MSKATSAANAGSPETTAKSDKRVRDDANISTSSTPKPQRNARRRPLRSTSGLVGGRNEVGCLCGALQRRRSLDDYHTRRARAATDPAQIGSPRNAARPPTLRRIVVSERPSVSAGSSPPPGRYSKRKALLVDPWGVARPMHAMGFRAGEIVLNTFSYHLVPSRFHDGFRRARTRMRRHSSGSRQYRTTVRIDRSLSAQPLLRHARLPQDPSQNGGRYRARRQFSSSARWSPARPSQKHFRARSQRQELRLSKLMRRLISASSHTRRRPGTVWYQREHHR